MLGITQSIVPSDSHRQRSPSAIYIGEPHPEHHPVPHQDTRLSTERGRTIPEKITDSSSKLYALAQKNGICFADLCVYALTVAAHKNSKD